MMSILKGLEFWQAVYLARVTAGCIPPDSRETADRALKDWEAVQKKKKPATSRGKQGAPQNVKD